MINLIPRLSLSVLLVFCCELPLLAAEDTFYAVGAAQVDITPDYPIRLSGYGARQKESEGIDQHTFAQALAIGGDKKSLTVMITVDNVAVPAYDARHLWVNAYANDVPCHIPSQRIWREGGYEGGDAMIYYDRPIRLAEETEELIVSTVHELLPSKFLLAK